MAAAGTLACVLAATLSANRDYSYTEHASKLYNDLLEDYVKAVPPMSKRGPSAFGSEAGTDVSLQLRFFKLDSVEAALGKMSVKVWWRMKWKDDRLSWDPNEYGNITEVKFHASSYSDPETADIWLPDFTPYNAENGLMSSFDASMAKVDNNGNVFWSRPGILSVMCRFSGLVKFPQGPLSCYMEVGGWMASARTQGLIPYAPSASSPQGCSEQSMQELVANPSYTEYSIKSVNCSLVEYSYPSGFAGEVWPIMQYKIELERSTFYYWIYIIIPSIAYTLLSFSVFFMSFEVGERLGYGITLLLTTEVSKSIVASQVPSCGELLWIELFFMINIMFTMISLLESTIVLALAFNTEEYLVPPFFNPWRWEWLAELCCAGKASKINPDEDDDEKMAAFEAKKTKKKPQDSAAANRMRTLVAEGAEVKSAPPMPKSGEGQDAFMDAAGRLMFFENLFFRLDPQGIGSISTEDIRCILAFTALDMSADDFEAALVKADSVKRDGRLDCAEFVDLCIEILWNVPVEQLESAASNYACNVEALEKRINTQWRRIANDVDRYSRFWIPFLYLIGLAFLFSLDLQDTYTEADESMQGAWQAMSIAYNSWVIPVVLTPLIIVLVTIVVAEYRRRSKEARTAKMLEMTATSSASRARVRMDQDAEKPATAP